MTATARTGDPITSHEAAASVRWTASLHLQFDILDALMRDCPFGRHSSDEQIETWIATKRRERNFTLSGLRTRRHELVERGYIVPAGYGQTRAGRACLLWKLTAAGVDRWAALKEML